jgi:hypothetical protein
MTQIIEKNVNRVTFYFVEDAPGRATEDIKKECKVDCFDFLFFSVFFVGRRGWGKRQSA